MAVKARCPQTGRLGSCTATQVLCTDHHGEAHSPVAQVPPLSCSSRCPCLTSSTSDLTGGWGAWGPWGCFAWKRCSFPFLAVASPGTMCCDSLWGLSWPAFGHHVTLSGLIWKTYLQSLALF